MPVPMTMVVIMVAGVITRVIMVMPSVIIVPVVMMSMPMVMRMSAMGMIGSTCRLEGLFYIEHGGAESLQHGADDMVAQDNDAIFLNLGC